MLHLDLPVKVSYLPCCPPRSLSTPFINLWRCPYALIPISLSSSCPMSANTSRVIWKGERPQKSLAKPGPIPKAEDPSVQKIERIHDATKRVYIYICILCFAALLIAATFWQASPYHRTIASCYSLKLCKTYVSYSN